MSDMELCDSVCPVCFHDCYGSVPQRYCLECGWNEKLDATQNKIVALMLKLTDDKRLEVMCEFCRYCGSTNPECVCWNDE